MTTRKNQVPIILFILLLIFMVATPRQDILHTDIANAFAESSAAHWLGTDNLGRDVYSLIVEGGFRTLFVVGISGLISFTAGSFLGMAEAFLGKSLRVCIQFFADISLIVPTFVMAMIFSALFGFHPVVAGILFGIGNIGDYINQAYDLSESVCSREFIYAEKVVGLNNIQIMFGHVLPNIYRQLFVFAGNKSGNVIAQYSGLAFIGLGCDVTNPDWGTLLYQYRVYVTTCPRLILYPTLAIAVFILLLHFIFDVGVQKEEEKTIYD